jgi:hypothetical protein
VCCTIAPIFQRRGEFKDLPTESLVQLATQNVLDA